MGRETPTQTLTDARDRGLSWRLIVEALRELTASSPLDSKERPWLEVASTLTGYTIVQLRQAQRTYATIEKFIETQDLPSHSLDWPMSNLEVISRISKLNPENAEKLLISRSLKTWRELLNIYETLRDEPGTKISPMSAGHRSAKAFSSKILHMLSQDEVLNQILGDGAATSSFDILPWPGRFLFAHPDFVVGFKEAGVSRVAAFEGLRFYGEINLQAAANAAVKAAVEATFFARYYWCISVRDPIDSLLKMKDQLAITNLGILIIESNLVEILSAPSGLPIPNRQHMLTEDPGLQRRLHKVL